MSEEQDLPWWTAEEQKAVDELMRTTRDYDLPMDVTPWQAPVRRLLERQQLDHDDEDTTKWISYKAQVLDKYRSNPYCDIGYDNESKSHYIRFLNTDSSKPPDSRVSFHYVSDPQDVTKVKVKVKVADSIMIPPRQMQHWNHYRYQSSVT